MKTILSFLVSVFINFIINVFFELCKVGMDAVFEINAEGRGPYIKIVIKDHARRFEYFFY